MSELSTPRSRSLDISFYQDMRAWNGGASDATERESVLSMTLESEASNMATKVTTLRELWIVNRKS